MTMSGSEAKAMTTRRLAAFPLLHGRKRRQAGLRRIERLLAEAEQEAAVPKQLRRVLEQHGDCKHKLSSEAVPGKKGPALARHQPPDLPVDGVRSHLAHRSEEGGLEAVARFREVFCEEHLYVGIRQLDDHRP